LANGLASGGLGWYLAKMKEEKTDKRQRCGFTLIDVFHRPVLMKTERDENKFFESIFYFIKE
jgi:hypothetical protein